MGFFLLGLVASLLLILGFVLMFFFDKACCKHCVYLSCFLMGLLFILYFIVAVVFGILTPSSYMICEGANNLFNNKTAIQTLTSSFGSAAPMLSSCLAGGKLVGASSYDTALTNIDSVTGNSQNFSASITSKGLDATSINANLSIAEGIITDVQNNKLSDLTNANALAHLTRVASRSYSATSCTGTYSSDSWVPNVAGTVINCASGATKLTGNCSDLNAAGCSTGCFGFTQQLGTATNNQCGTYNCTASASVATQLNTRYGAGCRQSTLLANLNTNYDAVRQSALDTLKTTLNGASGGLKSVKDYSVALNAVASEFTTLNAYIDGFKNSLGNDTGLAAGLTCGPLVAQLNVVLDQYCKNVYTEAIKFNILLTLIVYSIVFAMCFSVCSANKFNRAKNSTEYTDQQQIIPEESLK
jgi:hypothetical protein